MLPIEKTTIYRESSSKGFDNEIRASLTLNRTLSVPRPEMVQLATNRIVADLWWDVYGDFRKPVIEFGRLFLKHSSYGAQEEARLLLTEIETMLDPAKYMQARGLASITATSRLDSLYKAGKLSLVFDAVKLPSVKPISSYIKDDHDFGHF